MGANNTLRVTELSYDALRDNLKDFLRTQSELQDYNFEGSTLAIILDLLAYNSYYNSFYANMVGNEQFIDSAVLRASVASRAKELDYLPRSSRSSQATLNLTLSSSNNQITIPAEFRFRSTFDNFTYYFSTKDAKTIYSDTGTYNTTIDIYEGIWTTQTHTVANPGFSEKFVILNQGVDTTSISVQVKASAISTVLVTYTMAEDILDIDGTSKVFFLNENIDGNYEISFGDGILGRLLEVGNQVIIRYRVCNGDVPNGIQYFQTVDSFANATFTYTTNSISSGGMGREDIESIRFNAPRSYDKQNRTVTKEDYVQEVLENNSDIQALAVWGGEDNDPPRWGRVMISAKPFNGFALTEGRKASIAASLDEYNVQAIEPTMVDPAIVYIVPDIRLNFNPDATTLNSEQIRAKVESTLVTFESNELSTFEKKFRKSTLVTKIDATDASIISNETSIKIQKRFSPILGSAINYSIPFYTAINRPYEGSLRMITSSGFTLPLWSQTLYLDDDGYGVIRAYYLLSGRRVYVNNEIGTVDYTTGKIILNNFNPSSYVGDEIKITIVPANENLSPVFNQILLISDTVIDIYDDNTGSILSSGTAATQGVTTSTFETPINNLTV